MLNLRKILVGTLALLVISGGLALSAPISSAKAVTTHTQQFQRGRVVVIVIVSKNFYNKHRKHFRTKMYRQYQQPRRIIFIDRDDHRQLVLSNHLTGPGSTNINDVRLTVDHDYFTRVSRNYSSNRNYNISVNTGNNTVSFNTVTGNIATGNVDIGVR